MHNGTSDSDARKIRTWGPFTGRQLTTVVCVLIVTVLFPVTAHAVVSGTSVFVTDKASGKTAAVDGDRNLQTRVNGGSLSIHGSVPGNLAPSAAFQESKMIAVTTTDGPIMTPRAGNELFITSAHVDWDNIDATGDHFASLTVGDSGTCANALSGRRVDWDFPTANDSQDSTFSPGFIVPAGKSACVHRSDNTAGSVRMTMFGYLAPAGSVSLPAASTGTADPATRR